MPGRPRRFRRHPARAVWATVVVACLLVGGVAALAFHAWAGGPGGAGAPPPTASSSAPATAPTSAGPTPAATPSPIPTPTPESTAVGIDLAAHSTTEPDSIWVVVNKQHPIAPLTYEPADLVNVGGTTIRAVAADDLQAMLAAAKADGVVMGLRTAYRSYGSQAAIRADVERRRGFAHAEKYSARPGYSEHQTGLSLDLHGTSRPGCDLSTCFADTAEGQWVAAHAAEYGFIVRYTPGNTAVTGFNPEAWHLRYVGRELSTWMRDNGVGSLEEVFGVTGGPDYPAGT